MRSAIVDFALLVAFVNLMIHHDIFGEMLRDSPDVPHAYVRLFRRK